MIEIKGLNVKIYVNLTGKILLQFLQVKWTLLRINSRLFHELIKIAKYTKKKKNRHRHLYMYI